jgi:hypothetical protein
MVLFRPGPRAGSDFDRGCGSDCAVYVSDYLVCLIVMYSRGWVLMWTRKFCLRHPEVRDVCDIGQYLFWDSKIAWYMTAVMFLLNNTFIQVFISYCNICHADSNPLRACIAWSVPNTSTQ